MSLLSDFTFKVITKYEFFIFFHLYSQTNISMVNIIISTKAIPSSTLKYNTLSTLSKFKIMKTFLEEPHNTWSEVRQMTIKFTRLQYGKD